MAETFFKLKIAFRKFSLGAWSNSTRIFEQKILLEQNDIATIKRTAGLLALTKRREVLHYSTRTPSYSKLLDSPLEEIDTELLDLIKQEKERQFRGLEMIASENFPSVAVLQCLSSCLHNKYSEGLPGKRYYGGNQFIDKVELLAQQRALDAFRLNPKEWGVNVQPYSGSPANLAVYTGLLQPHDRLMGLDLPDGGHLTHGYMTANKRVSATSLFFESTPYKVDPKTGLIDYDALEATAKLFKPKLIIAGITCYSRYLDYARFRKICDDHNAYLFADMAHVAGLVAANLIPSPFEFADVVSTTTHKTLRGPRAGVIFFRKGLRKIKPNGDKVMYDLERRINDSVFPGLQGGPHNNTIAGIAAAFKQATTPEFVQYQTQVIANARHLCECLKKCGYHIATGGTDVHLLLVDLRNKNLTGSQAEYILEQVSIACNKNTVPGDKSAMNPSGIRFGTPALTTRGLIEDDIEVVVQYIDAALELGGETKRLSGPKLADFKRTICENQDISTKVNELRCKVENFSGNFPLPGFEEI
uniref:Serine hydroxymethyltransferase n=1 Tax=Glossina brevipalpis TaxID=37001 RepID=A0A1A9WRX2_9MUSC